MKENMGKSMNTEEAETLVELTNKTVGDLYYAIPEDGKPHAFLLCGTDLTKEKGKCTLLSKGQPLHIAAALAGAAKYSKEVQEVIAEAWKMLLMLKLSGEIK